MVGSIPYLNRYVIQPAPLEPEFLIFVPPVICSVLSIPFWNWLSRIIGSKKTIVIGGALIVASGIPFLFISNAVTVIIFVSLMGIAQVAFGMQFTPILADIVDELVAKIGRRREGLIIGVRTFFGRLGIIVQAITFFLIHHFTGFDPDLPPGTPQSGIAILGLRIQLAVVPTIIMAIGVFVFWMRYDLDKKKKEIIHEILVSKKL
jgi:Na+/melibiose symporter-like transporter